MYLISYVAYTLNMFLFMLLSEDAVYIFNVYWNKGLFESIYFEML